MGRVKMAKNNKKEVKSVKDKKVKKGETDVNPKAKVMAIIILVMMVISVLGFAMLGTGLSSSADVNEQGIPNYLPFQQINSNGQLLWVASKNYELFVFENIEGYDLREDLAQIAFELKQKNQVNLVLDSNYSDSNFPFIIEQKFSKAFEIPVVRSNEIVCEENSVILTNNLNHSFDNCLVIASNQGEEQRDASILSYHLIVNE